MSGAEVLTVVGVIANIIALIDFSVDVYERAEGFRGGVNELPKAFLKTNEVLPLVKIALQQTTKRLNEGHTDEETRKALRSVLDGCEATVAELKEIFRKVVPAGDASKWTRGRRAISSVGKDKKIEALDKALMRFVEVLTLYHSSRDLPMPQITQALNESATRFAKKPLFMVRYQKDDSFIGREDVMLEISKRFEQNVPRVALAGIGGVGKSRIAIEYCYRHRIQNPSSNIFWVFGGSKMRLATAYQKIAEEMEIPGSDKPTVDILDLVSDWLSKEENGPWLIVLDNADDSDLWITSPEGPLIDYLPRGKHGSMLITTRNAQLGKTIADSRKKPIDVPIFGLEDSVALLQSKISEDDKVTNEDSKEIAQTLGCLPLAITQAAAYLDQNDTTVAEYLDLLNSSKVDTTDLLIRGSYDNCRDPDIQNSVFHTWKLSFDQMLREHPRAAEILLLTAYLDRQAIPVELLRRDDEGELDFREAIQRLKAFSLITEESRDEIFSIHRIVQLSIHWYHKNQGSLEMWQAKALNAVVSNFPWNADIVWIEKLQPHIQVVLSYTYSTQDTKVGYARILQLLGSYHHALGHLSIAIRLKSACLKLREKILDPRDKRIIAILTSLASTLTHAGSQSNFNLAEKLLDRALELSKDNPHLYHSSLAKRAYLLGKKGKLFESEELYRHALQFNIQKYGSESEEVSTILHDLADCYELGDRYGEAESLRRRVLTNVKTHQPKSLNCSITAEKLARNLKRQGRYSEALLLFREILAFRIELLGFSHPETLRTRNQLLTCLISSGGHLEAEKFGLETLQIGTGSEEKVVLDASDLFADNLVYLNRSDEAELRYRENLRLRIKTVGPGDEDTLETRDSLATLLVRNGKLEEAEELWNQSLSLRMLTLGPTDPSTIDNRRSLAETVGKSGRFSEAIELWKDQVKLEMLLEANGSLSTIRTMGNLAFMMQMSGGSENAESFYREMIKLCADAVGTTHPATTRIKAFLADHLARDGRLGEAEMLYSELLPLQTQRLKDFSDVSALNPIHRHKKLGLEDAVKDMIGYAKVLTKNEKRADAEHCLRDTIALSAKILGPEHVRTLKATCRLATLLGDLNRYEEAETLMEGVLNTNICGHDENSRELMLDVGELCCHLKKYIKAESVYRESVRVRTQVLGFNHPDTLEVMKDLGSVLCAQEKYKEAEAVYREAITIKTQIPGFTHQDTEDLWNLGDLFLDEMRYEEAELIFRDVLAMEVQTLGADNEDTLSTMSYLGKKLNVMEKCAEAEGFLRDALARCTRTFGSDGEKTLQTMFYLANALLHLNRMEEANVLLHSAFVMCSRVFGPDDKRTFQVKELLEKGVSASSPGTTSMALTSDSSLGDLVERIPGAEQEEAIERELPEGSSKRQRAEDTSLALRTWKRFKGDSGT